MSNIQTFDNSIDLMAVVPWQYDRAPHLISLLEKKSAWYKEHYSKFWDDWERDVFNLNTANDFGLNVWSIILNLPLYSRDDARPAANPAFGFSPFGTNFDQVTSNFAIDANAYKSLSLEEKRMLLKLRWYNITSDGSMSCVNETLYQVFGDKIYCLDGGDMTITFVFTGTFSAIMTNLLTTADILPRPSGVGFKIIFKSRPVFGFADYNLNFDQPNSQFGS